MTVQMLKNIIMWADSDAKVTMWNEEINEVGIRTNDDGTQEVVLNFGKRVKKETEQPAD